MFICFFWQTSSKDEISKLEEELAKVSFNSLSSNILIVVRSFFVNSLHAHSFFYFKFLQLTEKVKRKQERYVSMIHIVEFVSGLSLRFLSWSLGESKPSKIEQIFVYLTDFLTDRSRLIFFSVACRRQISNFPVLF